MIKHKKEIIDLKEECKTHQEVIEIMKEQIRKLEECLNDNHKSDQVTDIFEETKEML